MPKRSKIVSIARLKKKLDEVFNAYIRKRDSWGVYFTCISCGQTKPKELMHSGHFYARTFTATRWHEANSNGQCSACNTFKHGNLLEYRKGMIAKYGQEVVDELERLHNQPVKLDREWLIEQIEKYKSKA